MAVSANALTLGQYAIMSNDPLVQRITYSLLQNAVVLNDIPLVTRKTIVVNGVRWEGNLPSVNWSKLNVDPEVTSGTPTPYQEQAYILRNAIDVDKFLVEDQNQIVDPRGAQIEAYLRGAAYDINDKFINNDHISGDEDAFVGLRARLDNPTTYGVTSEMKINASALDMTQAGMTAATANNFLEFVQQVLDYMGSPDGTGVTLYMNDILKRRFARAIRLLGAGAGFNMVTDAFGRQVTMFQGAAVVDIGRKANQTTRIITDTETSAGAEGASDYTSFYAVRYGESGVYGWQFDALKAEDIGLIGNGGSTYRTKIDWAFGLITAHTRSIARVYGIKVK